MENPDMSLNQSKTDDLDALYEEYVDEDYLMENSADGVEEVDTFGERIDEQKKRLAKERKASQTQAQREAAATARKEAREAKAALVAKEKELAKIAAKESQKDTTQRTLLDALNSQKGRLDIDKRLQSLGETDDVTGDASAAKSLEQGHIAQLGKSVLAKLGALDDSDDDDDTDFGGLDLNAALFGDVQKNRAADMFFSSSSADDTTVSSTGTHQLGAKQSSSTTTTIAAVSASSLVDRLGEEQAFDYGTAAAIAKKKGAPIKKSSSVTTAASPASKPAAPVAAGNINFKVREAGVVATSEHIQLGSDTKEEQADDDAKEDTLLNAAAAAAKESQQSPGAGGGSSASTVLPQDAVLMPGCMAQSHGIFYWLDAKEVGPHSSIDAGSVYLLGKLLIPGGRVYESCCVRVNNAYRSVMFRPMPNAMEAAMTEIQAQFLRQGIKLFQMKKVKRYYVFDEPDVPREKRELQEWIKVNYLASLPLFSVPQAMARPPMPDGSCPPPAPLPGYHHVELCIGAERSLTETFLLKRRIKAGPCFIRFNERLQPVPITARVSHCKHEFIVTRPKSVFVWDSSFKNSDYNAIPSSVPVYNGGRSGMAAAGAPSSTQYTTQQYFAPPSVPPTLTGATIQLITQMNVAGSQNEIFAICIALCTNSILPDGGKKAVPAMEHALLVRPWDSKSPLPMELINVGRNAQLRITPLSNEKEMLQWLVDFLVAQDPDVLLGHNFVSFTLDVLLHRMQALYIHNWSALGRVRQSIMPQLQKGAGGMRESTYAEKEACVGRLLCDTYLLAREHHKSSNYKLISLAREMGLKGIYSTGITLEMVEEPPVVVNKEVLTITKEAVHILGRCLNLSRLTFELAYRLDMIPLTKQLCERSGTTWSRVLIGSRSERIEFLLLHAFYAQKYVLPEKKRFSFNNNAAAVGSAKRLREDDGVGGAPADADAVGAGDGGADVGNLTTTNKRSAKYKGGMVLEPISGLYQDYILLLDFNSLYPSLIQEFNICFTTVNRSGNPNTEVSVPLAEDLACAACVERGLSCPHKMILPKVIERLVSLRRDVKRRMKSERNEEVLGQLDIRQRALKLTANSMYGCLGFEYSRFYAQPLAELVTSKGRDTLSNTVALIPTVAPSLRVIYGDTDSVMMQTGVRDSLATVREFGQKIQAAVNKKYKKLEIGIDGVFRSILLMTKKKYAALSVNNWEGAGDDMSEVVKGLDMVRRDWCPLVRIACQDILHRILRGVASPNSATAQHVVKLLLGSQPASGHGEGDEDDVLQFILAYMQKVAEDVRAGNVYELKEFVICKSLTKEPESYKGDNFPHATVALRMKHRKEAVRVGDLIPYVICKERSRLPNAQRIKHENESDTKPEANVEVPVSVKKENADGDDDTAAKQDQDVTAVDGYEDDMGSSSKLSHHAYHEDEVKKDPSKHHLDVEWYLSTQIYPPVLRICQHIQGFSAAQLAEYMQLKNAHQIAATEEAADGGSGAGGGGGSAGNTWGTFDTQYLSRFKTNRLEECFPLAEAVQIKCTRCSRISSLQPHEYVEKNILPLYREKKKDHAFLSNPYSVFPPFHLYTCSNCHSAFPLSYVANTMSLFIQQHLRAFYSKGGSAKEVAKVQSQLSYLRALFDVPHLPGVSPDVIALHKQFALRCQSVDGGMYTLSQAEAFDAADPVKELVERNYRRINGLRVDTGLLFKSVDL